MYVCRVAPALVMYVCRVAPVAPAFLFAQLMNISPDRQNNCTTS
ncbi:hypothetical protein LTSESEN_3209 [Salmonella enterica subsp. enterica serovar Senftenberg str. A4-543]|uniref:Uncharacterized protein n=1 Tax=Salmonella enterica subsp. enterica serovar Senftenberg str. A4-543 TaxID=913082 RepID=G5R1K6_SALSE|nr:hypothetical protein LTSESEN_3209 [Salmonella enterica subsp. enterica serovar Senftenberg str. A4-543]